MAPEPEREQLLVGGRDVTVTNPRKVLFPAAGLTKLDVVRYYVGVAEGAIRAAGGRPNMLVRYPNGIGAPHFYQKRAPTSRPDWIEVVELRFPSGRRAEELVPRDAASLAWMANLACLELHPHAVRAEDMDHPDELRVDLDPVPGVPWTRVREVAAIVRSALSDVGLIGWPKTSGSRGIHVNVRIQPHWTFVEVRRAALALAREVERRADAEPGDFTLKTMPVRFAQVGDRHAGIDREPCSLAPLLELSARQEREGQGDAPWPPHYQKQTGEPPRVAPSRARASARRTPSKARKAR